MTITLFLIVGYVMSILLKTIVCQSNFMIEKFNNIRKSCVKSRKMSVNKHQKKKKKTTNFLHISAFLC